jgi:type VI protein secretion system component VasK
MKKIWAVMVCLNVLVLLWLVGTLPAPSQAPKLTYDQFITISLTVMTIVLAVVALLMAYLAFEGKHQIIERAKEAAIAEFEKAKPEFLDLLRNEARDRLEGFVMEEGNRLYDDLAVTSSANGFDRSSLPDDLKEVRNE